MYSSQDKPKIILSWRLAQTSNILSQKSEIFFCSESPSKNLLHGTFVGKRKENSQCESISKCRQKDWHRAWQLQARVSLSGCSQGQLWHCRSALQADSNSNVISAKHSNEPQWWCTTFHLQGNSETGINPAVHAQPKFQPTSLCNVGQFRSTHFKEVI